MSDFKIPPHELKIDEVRFLELMGNSSQFTDSQKIKIIDNIPKMKQWQLDDLMEELEHAKDHIAPKTIDDTDSPATLLKYLNQHVAGQELSKQQLALTFYEHTILKKEDHTYLKPNLLLVGPTGSGKTFMVSLLAQHLKRPFVAANAAAMVSSGYVGTRLDDILTRLYIQSDKQLDRAESGIILVDEFDKMVDGNSHDSVGGVELQQEFLKLVEGGKHICKSNLSRDASRIEINTDNVLFIFAGAFVGLKDIIGKRMAKKQIGFKTVTKMIEEPYLLDSVCHEDIIQYGIIPEMVGRIQGISPLHELTANDLVSILNKPENPYLKSLHKFIDFHNNSIEFTPDALTYIATKALEKKIGARGLKPIIDRLTLKFKLEATTVSGKLFTITGTDLEHILP